MRRATLVVRVGRGTMRAEVTRAGTVLWAVEAAFASEEDLVAALGAAGETAVAEHPVKSARIELDGSMVQLRTLAGLPPVRRSALQALVAHDSGRFFRRNGKPLVTDAAWERGPRGGARVAMAAAVEEPWVEAILKGLRAAGVEPEVVSPVGCSLDLLPVEERRSRRRAAGKQARWLAITAALLWGLVGGLAVRRLIRDGAAVDDELASLGPATVAARQVRQEYDGAEAMIAALAGASRRRGAVASRVAAILIGLPDSAYLTALHVSDDSTGEITGAARRPLDVVTSLDRSRVVESPRLTGSSARIPVGALDYEGFTVRFGRDSAR